MDYKQAGVNIAAGNLAVELMKKDVQRTLRPEVLSGLGGFGSLFALDLSKYPEPVLVSGTDGVGTKLKIAFLLNKHHTIGIDLVAMCVNDILTLGAEPLYFLDYIACGLLVPEKIALIVKGITEGCLAAGCTLAGGETAEMPGFYSAEEYDLAGFAVGVVNKNRIVEGKNINEGDVVLGLASSGLHSNGYSLVRKILLEEHKLSLNETIAPLNKTLGEELLTPTKIYVRSVLNLLSSVPVKGMAHITGGGLIENIPRILPDGSGVTLTENSWKSPAIFSLIAELGKVSKEEMYQVFNLGIGFVLVVAKEDSPKALEVLRDNQEQAFPIGVITRGKGVSFK